MINHYLIGIAGIVLPYAALFYKLRRMRIKEMAWSRTPFSEKLMRPAGESLRLEIARLQERRDESALNLAGIIIVPGIAAMLVSLKTPSGWIFLVTFTLGCYAVAYYHWRNLLKLRNEIRNYELGFDGERYIASELNRLIAHGYHVFNDFIFDMRPGGDASTFNIDHIAIGPAGLLVIETKTRRKPLQIKDATQANHEVIYDGEALILPGGFRDRRPIRQVQSSAQQLHSWLVGRLQTSIPITPVVVMPGWMVHRKSESPVLVLSGRELVQKIASLPRTRMLSKVQLDSYVHRLETHCRSIDPR